MSDSEARFLRFLRTPAGEIYLAELEAKVAAQAESVREARKNIVDAARRRLSELESDVREAREALDAIEAQDLPAEDVLPKVADVLIGVAERDWGRFYSRGLLSC